MIVARAVRRQFCELAGKASGGGSDQPGISGAQGHPDANRSGLYADGGRQGAPAAVQITDRYHLMSNLVEAVERDIQQLKGKARAALAKQATTGRRKGKKLTLIEVRRQRCRQARYELYQAVVELGRQGYPQLAIAERMGLGAGTVARWLSAASFPERQIRSDRHRDQALYLQDQERSMQTAQLRTHLFLASDCGGADPESAAADGSTASSFGSLSAVLPAGSPAAQVGFSISRTAALAAGGQIGEMDGAGHGLGFPLGQFAKTLRRDLKAVELAIETPWSNGPLEGHINRLKAIKRQMYGRAGFELLRARVLPWQISTAN